MDLGASVPAKGGACDQVADCSVYTNIHHYQICTPSMFIVVYRLQLATSVQVWIEQMVASLVPRLSPHENLYCKRQKAGRGLGTRLDSCSMCYRLSCLMFYTDQQQLHKQLMRCKWNSRGIYYKTIVWLLWYNDVTCILGVNKPGYVKLVSAVVI